MDRAKLNDENVSAAKTERCQRKDPVSEQRNLNFAKFKFVPKANDKNID